MKTKITAATGDVVSIGVLEINHALEGHFDTLPEDLFLELLQRVLKNPTVVYQEESKHLYHHFYQLQNGKYLVAIVKKLESESFFATMYPTGKSVRNKHKKLKKVPL